MTIAYIGVTFMYKIIAILNYFIIFLIKNNLEFIKSIYTIISLLKSWMLINYSSIFNLKNYAYLSHSIHLKHCLLSKILSRFYHSLKIHIFQIYCPINLSIIYLVDMDYLFITIVFIEVSLSKVLHFSSETKKNIF